MFPITETELYEAARNLKRLRTELADAVMNDETQEYLEEVHRDIDTEENKKKGFSIAEEIENDEEDL